MDSTITGYRFYDIEITGIAPMLCHNGQLADPLNEFTKKLKEVSKKRLKTEADFERMAEIEFHAGFYVDQDGKPTIDGRVIEAVVHAGAKKSKEGKTALAAMFVEPGIDFKFAGPKTVEARWKKKDCRLTIGVRVGQAKIMRTRPIFNDWKLRFTVSVIANQIDGSQLEQWLKDAGMLVGLCDWRPRYGRFALTSFVEQKIAQAA